MKRLLSAVMLALLLSTALASPQASVVPIKHQKKDPRVHKHKAHKATKHKAPKHPHHTL